MGARCLLIFSIFDASMPPDTESVEDLAFDSCVWRHTRVQKKKKKKKKKERNTPPPPPPPNNVHLLALVWRHSPLFRDNFRSVTTGFLPVTLTLFLLTVLTAVGHRTAMLVPLSDPTYLQSIFSLWSHLSSATKFAGRWFPDMSFRDATKAWKCTQILILFCAAFFKRT